VLEGRAGNVAGVLPVRPSKPCHATTSRRRRVHRTRGRVVTKWSQEQTDTPVFVSAGAPTYPVPNSSRPILPPARGARRVSMQEFVVVSEHIIPGASPRLQVVLRDPRDRLEGPVIPLEQCFVAEGRYILGHGPKATSLVTQWSRATALHLRPRAHGKANSRNDARIVSRFGPIRRRVGVTGWGPQWHRRKRCRAHHGVGRTW